MKKLFLIFMIIAVTGCSNSRKLTKKYEKSHQLRGYASWYGKEFHKKLTASGEKYNIRRYTAAHKTLKFGTLVKVVNLKNGNSVKVKINDRGPFVAGRVIDLSPKAFKQLAPLDTGIVPVKILILDDDHTFRYKK